MISRIVKMLMPPIVWDGLKWANKKFRNGSEWQIAQRGWQDNNSDWNIDATVDVYVSGLEILQREYASTDPIGKHNTLDPSYHNTIMSYAYALGRVASEKSKISVLDYGGGVGTYYVISRALYPNLELDYHCKDMTAFVNRGRSLFPDIKFYDDDSCLSRSYDFILISGTLQYLKNWQVELRQIAAAASRVVFVTRVPVVQSAPTYLAIQHAGKYLHGADHQTWCINQHELLAIAKNAGLELKRIFVLQPPLYVQGAPENPQMRGFLFTRF